MKRKLICLALGATAASTASASDFGEKVEALARALSNQLFGIARPLAESSTASISAADADSDAASLVTAADGLRVTVVSAHADLGPNIDMMALWPNETRPTHLIACNEQDPGDVAVQRINLKTGVPEDIISSGLDSCDPVRRTAWGTVIVGEEAGSDGRVFEILDPLGTTGVVITGFGAATVSSDPGHVVRREAVGQLSFEGIALLPNGVMYSSDENRPSSGNPGGGIFKFIPSVPWTGGPPITALDQSPLVDGTIWGLRIGVRSGNTDFGQGNEFGRGVWVQVDTSADPIDLRAAGRALKLTHYYRPEDMDVDLAALQAGRVRCCSRKTGDDGENDDQHFGEIYCLTDGTIAEATDTSILEPQTVGADTFMLNLSSVPEYQLLVIGNREFAMMDNIAYQPGRGNWIVHEDGEGPKYSFPRNNDIWACTDDGADEDNLADACVRVMTLNDLGAESTGGLFDASGKTFYFSVQHNVTGHGVILKVTGWDGRRRRFSPWNWN